MGSPEIPELDYSRVFGSRQEEVLAAGIKEGEAGNGDVATAGRYGL